MKKRANIHPYPVPRAQVRGTLRTAARTLRLFVGCGVFAAALLAVAVALTGCNKQDQELLPDGKQPVTLIAGIGQAQTRTTAGTDDTQTIWKVDDKIGFFADGYINIPCTATTTDGSGWSGLYWMNTTPLTNIKAYYPYREGGYQEEIWSNLYDTFTIQENQSTEDNYYQSDVLKGTAGETSFNSHVALNFTHVMSKLTVQLTTENEKVVSLADLKGATVQVTNMYTKGYFASNSNFTPSGSGSTITMLNPSKGTEARFQAIAIPGVSLSSNNEIIITSADRQRVYKGSFPNVGPLTANQQHAFIFKVTKNLTVTVTPVATGVGWNEGTISSSTPTESFYTLYFPASRTDIKSLKVNGEDVTGNSYQMKAGATGFTVTYQHIDGTISTARFLPGFGRYKLTRSYDNVTKTYTDTYSELKSDLSLTWVHEMTAVGDYLYADGTWLGHLRNDKTCVGIVFYAGQGPEDNVSNYSNPSLSAIHGYAVALKDGANSEKKQWFSGEYPSLSLSSSQTAFNGYSNTLLVKNSTGYSATRYPAVASCIDYNVSVTGGSSWYLPSSAQFLSFYAQRGVIHERMQHISGNVAFGNYYWSSTKDENNNTNFWGLWNGTYGSYYGVNTYYTRPVITF